MFTIKILSVNGAQYWTGRGWSSFRNKAKVFRKISTATKCAEKFHSGIITIVKDAK